MVVRQVSEPGSGQVSQTGWMGPPETVEVPKTWYTPDEQGMSTVGPMNMAVTDAAGRALRENRLIPILLVLVVVVLCDQVAIEW